MARDLPSGTVTFLFTDVEGSTRLLHDLGAEGYAEALADHRRVIREASTAEGGVEVDTQGDAFFFAFPTAPGALAAAAAFTEALASGPIQVRVGLHTGTPLVTEEGYVGDDVHFAARVAGTSHGGQVVLSAATAERVELALTDLGEHRLKDIEQAVSIYQLGEGSFPPLKTISNTNLPRPASSFLGREAELEEVISRIRAGARLVTLTGPGGTGKTRLAIEGASSLVSEYKAGVFWVGLASLRDPALVSETIAQTLGAKDALAADIGERELLLLLDNLEQVIECAPELSALLQACPNLTLLVTSRELLRISGEVEYAVPPLATQEAVDLFCARSGLEPSTEIAELCARLDSLPLAVELAAARTKALSASQILERLSGRLDLLKGGRDADPRQQTLRATIEWSYELLNEEEKQLFARLSVFAGGCTLEAAEEVARADLDTLQSLVEKSLLRFTDSRYWMLETIREFARNALGVHPDTGRRHAGFFDGLVRRMDAELRGDHDHAVLDLLALEHDNVRAALLWCLDNDPALGMHLAIAMERFWWMRGPVAEAERWFTDFLARKEALTPELVAGGLTERAWIAGEKGEWGRALEDGEEARRIAEQLGDDDIGYRALAALAEAYGATGRYADADAAYEEARALARRAGNKYREGATLYNQGQFAHRQGDLERARVLTERSLVLAREVGTDEGVAGSLMALGALLREEGRYQESLEKLRFALTEAIRIGFPGRSAVCLFEVAAVLVRTGRAEQAAVLVAAAEQVFENEGIEPDPLGGEVMAQLKVLGDESLDRLVTTGRAMDLEVAVDYALASID